MSDSATLVVVPAYQEEQALPGTLKELHDVVPELDVLVVDDGSRDATAKVAAAATDVTVARLPFNLGVGAAVRTGLRYAVDNGYQRVVVVDADGQHDPATIATLLGALEEGADMVIALRFAGGSSQWAPAASDEVAAPRRSLADRPVVHRHDVGVRAFDAGRRDARRDYPSSTSPTRSRCSSWCAGPATRSSRCRWRCAPAPAGSRALAICSSPTTTCA